jgi:regulator of replication initiation timing
MSDHHAVEDLIDENAALRAEVERLKGEVAATHDVTERRVQYAQQKMMEAYTQLAASEARVKELEARLGPSFIGFDKYGEHL